MVSIVNPHIKRDSGYHVFSEAEAKDLFVKKADGTSVYEGWCWPGSSSWLDFLNPAIQEWWSGMFSLDKYQVKPAMLWKHERSDLPSMSVGFYSQYLHLE